MLKKPKMPGMAPPVEDAGTFDWFYESDGLTVGPVHEKEMVKFIQSNSTIFRDTRVWNKSLPDWKRAEETILTIYFSESHSRRGRSARPKMTFLPHLQVLCKRFL
jgi:hypothetical protein